MQHGLPPHFAEQVHDKLRFIKGLVSQPKQVGAIAPTSAHMARRMAGIANPVSHLPVLELGPGTGVVTRALLERGVVPERIVAIEYSPDFSAHLRREMPGINVLQGCAFNLDKTLGEFATQQYDCAISGLPLLNFAMADRIALLNSVLDRLPAGRPFLQFSYGPAAPIPRGHGPYHVARHGWELRNLPPAQMWVYHRNG
mgnify:CR=1 FL=1